MASDKKQTKDKIATRSQTKNSETTIEESTTNTLDAWLVHKDNGDSTFQSFVEKSLSQLINGQKQHMDKISALEQEMRTANASFKTAIEFNAANIQDNNEAIGVLKKSVSDLERKVTGLESTVVSQTLKLNQMERINRKNNLRIVGIPEETGENLLQVTKTIFQKIFEMSDVEVERAHRDGKSRENKPRHILVKLLRFNDKIKILTSARQKLQHKTFHIVDDLTKTDLTEKQKWRSCVKEEFNKGNRLKFFAGRWRQKDGQAFNFN